MKALFAILLLLSVPARAERIVSLNLCADQLSMLLAPEQVIALSILARDPALSFVSDEAALKPIVRADAEAVLRLHPSLVLAGRYGAQSTLATLERQGVRVVRLDQPSDFEAIRSQTTAVAALLGEPDRGRALLAAMDAELAQPPGHTSTGLLWGARGWTSGPGSLGDAVLRAAGLRNASAGGAVGIEALLAHPPHLLVTATAPTTPSLATDLLRHPALAHIARREVPPALLICAGPYTAQAVSLLRAGT